jgi:OOP family OmpA-OmpF porin
MDFGRAALAALACVGLLAMAPGARAEEKGSEPKWYLSLGAGVCDFEGDAWVQDGLQGAIRVGYDLNDRWTLEGALHIAPSLDANEKISGIAFDSTSAYALALDGLFHFTRWERLDPFLAVGCGVVLYGDEMANGSKQETMFRGGGGVMYHFNDEWAVRADYRGTLIGFGDNPSSSSFMDAGVIWFWGANVPVKLVATSATLDSDGDGLTDREEEETYHTDPYDPDTDRDRLTDGQEVRTYRTNPLDKDTDMDLLTDGEEVLDVRTDPLDRDTDKGGVCDGHEVLEDGTDPNNGKDDHVLFELYINCDYNKAILKPQYFPQVDVLAKVLKRNPQATAVLEGHTDKLKSSGRLYNRRLSKQRAGSVLDYLVGKGIEEKRMDAVGFGFDRPKYPNHPVDGNPLNRRVDVYIKGMDKSTLPADMIEFKAAGAGAMPELPESKPAPKAQPKRIPAQDK